MRPSFAIVIIFSLGLSFWASAKNTAIFQGQVQQDVDPYTGTLGMEFRLYDSLTDGSQIKDTEPLTAVLVEDGLFRVELDCYWLIVRCSQSQRWQHVRSLCRWQSCAHAGKYWPLLFSQFSARIYWQQS